MALKEFFHKEVKEARIVFLDLSAENNTARFIEIINILYIP